MRKPNRAVITGASSGIGEAFAYELATRGVNLVIAARRTEQLQLLASSLTEKYPITVEILTLDLNENDAAERLFAFATRDGKKVDLLINCAGAGPYRHFMKSPLNEHRKIMQLNMMALTSICHLFAEEMLKNATPAYILNVSSIGAYQPVSRFAVYCATKSYVKIFSEILNYELRNSCVSVSCLCPGGTKTDFLNNNNQKSKSGDLFLMSPQKVAREGIEGTLARKSIIIPGWINKLSAFFPRFLPNKMNLMISEKAMQLAVEEDNS